MSISVKSPTHPGEIVRRRWLEPKGLTIVAGAELLGVHPVHLSRVLRGVKGISSRMAVRLENLGWGRAEDWMRLQAARELAKAREEENKARKVANLRRTG